ncbi:MAG TPA: hypothetical protein PLJ42_06785 [Chitinophagales bacterium]|jgi:hypothetical protein|nr:hypothetical protein [Chitinophagales bacterium]MBP6154264.1 hypothetical protein [Chitinophagales bacterium]HQV78763.1 hypothetical protein [Chitinophagales bacterium]HQW79129.1 hypothetical protein [Chitinophagales bacterium]HRB67863.1 hypothetical protein [Chitinophagales bacterium]
MDALIELVKIVNKKRLSKIDVFDKTFINQDFNNLYYKLYDGLESGRITNDITAAKFIYGSNEKDAKFRKLKSRFKSKILKTILLFDVDELFNYELGKAYYECITHSHIIEILVKLTGTSTLVVELIKENYTKAQKYQFYDILKSYSYLLMTYYALKGNKKLFTIEEEYFNEYSEMLKNEQIAKNLYNKGIVEIVSASSINQELLDKIHAIVEELNTVRLKVENPEIQFFYFYVSLLYHEYKNDLKGILKLCDATEALLDEYIQVSSNNRRVILLVYRLRSNLQLGNYEVALQMLETNLAILPERNKYNWYIVKEIEFKIYLRDHKIQEAYHVYEEVIANPTFKRQTDELTERWKIYQAYLIFMDNYLNKGEYKFSLGRFMNDVPVNSKDKSGFNFAIRIISILFQAARDDFSYIFSNMEALRVYRSRYLNDNTYKRNHLFLSAMMKAEKSGFNAKTMLQSDWQELDELRRPNANIIADWEIIPYHQLWDIFVSLCKLHKIT